MRITTFFRTSITATLVAFLIATGSTFADKDGKGGGGGDRGGGDRGGSRSSGGDKSGGSRSSGGGDRSSKSSGRSSDNDRKSDNQSTFRSSKGSNDSDKDSKSFQFKSSDKLDKPGSQLKQGSRDYQTRRPSDDQVRDMLKQGNDSNKNDNNKYNGKNADRFRDRSPNDKALVDREYNKWQNTWSGDKNDKGDKVGKGNNGRNGSDHRDWSGNWKNSDRFTVADQIRGDWRKGNGKGKDYAFSDNWWNGKHHGNSWNFWGDYGRRGRHSNYWWNWANGPGLGSWFVFGWPSPYYWDYGQGEYIYADNGAIYVNGRWYAPAPVFYNQTVQLIDQNPPLTADTAAKLDWLPLGVFAATPDGLNEPEITVQLATTKDGVIGGTAFDQKTGAAFAIQGTVDKKTQRAVWSYTNDRNQRIMMETSVYNLTQPEATGLIHYSPTDMKVVELVRLEQPEANGAAAADSSLPAPPVAQ